MTSDKILLGKALFFEEQMSATHAVACATCHSFTRGGGADHRAIGADSVHPGVDGIYSTRDDIAGSRGVPGKLANGSFRSTLFGIDIQITGRRAMPVINAAFSASLFWDGRAGGVFRDPLTQSVALNGGAALESQAVGPLMSDVEMAHFGQTWADVVQRLSVAVPLALASDVPAPLAQFVAGRSYADLFQLAFGTNAITPSRIGMAIATYERTLVADQTPWDAFQRGVPNALTPQQDRGRQLFFNGVTECSDCHGGANFAVNQFFYTGVAPQNEDLGRFAVTNNNADRGRMRAPTLRNVAMRAPYFHNGSARTLREVVDFYARGGDFQAGNRDPRIRGFNMNSADRDALVAFLGALTDPRVAAGLAPFDQPTLYAENHSGVAVFGVGTAGSNGITPRLLVHEPPQSGLSTFALGLDRAAGNALAFLALGLTPEPAGQPLLGANVFVSFGPGSAVVAHAYSTSGSSGQAFASHVEPIPGDPALRGVQMTAQWLVLEASDWLGATRAATLTIQ